MHEVKLSNLKKRLASDSEQQLTRTDSTMSLRWSIHRRTAAVLLGVVAVAAVGASAASLGGLESNAIGADTGIVASCDANGMNVEFRTRFHPRSGVQRVDGVILHMVSETCLDLPYQLTLFDDADNIVEVSGDRLRVRNIRDRQPGTGVDRAGTARIGVRFPSDDVDHIALVIGGATTP